MDGIRDVFATLRTVSLMPPVGFEWRSTKSLYRNKATNVTAGMEAEKMPIERLDVERAPTRLLHEWKSRLNKWLRHIKENYIPV
jgi:hypothetical protein